MQAVTDTTVASVERRLIKDRYEKTEVQDLVRMLQGIPVLAIMNSELLEIALILYLDLQKQVRSQAIPTIEDFRKQISEALEKFKKSSKGEKNEKRQLEHLQLETSLYRYLGVLDDNQDFGPDETKILPLILEQN